MMEKPHDHVPDGLPRMDSLVNGRICVKTCLRIFLKEIKTTFLRKREFMAPLFPVRRKFL
jgi:hypothetical protein